MEIIQEERNSLPVIRIIDEVSMYEIDPLGDILNDLIAQGKFKIIFDLELVPFIDSSGIGIILKTLANLNKNNGTIYFASCTGPVENVLKISIKNTKAKLFPNLDEAVKAFSKYEE